MIPALFGLLLQAGLPPATPTPGPSVGRTTPVPAKRSLQDLASEKRNLSSGSSGRGTLSMTTRIESVRTERVSARVETSGLVISGDLVIDRVEHVRGVVEVFASRRDGTTAQGFVPFSGFRGRTTFSSELGAPNVLTDPRSLRFDTAGARPHVLPSFPWWAPESREYEAQADCLGYWAKPVFNEKAHVFDQVEVHVQNSCPHAVSSENTWFNLAIEADSYGRTNAGELGLILRDVPAHGEITQLVPAKVQKDRRVLVEVWHNR